MNLGTIGSMRELGITESYKLKRQVVLSASEAAEMIIRSVLLSSTFDLPHFTLPVSMTFYEHPRGGVRQFESGPR